MTPTLPMILLCVGVAGAQAQPVGDVEDFAARHNARFADLPLEERAWPLYAELQAAMLPHLGQLRQRGGSAPGDATWPEASDLIANIGPLVPLAEALQTRPVLGWEWTDVPPPEWVRTVRGPDAEVRERRGELMLVNSILPYLSTVRTAAACLRIEALRQAELGDLDRAVATLELVPAMVEHLGETRTALTAIAAVSTEYAGIVTGVQQLLALAGQDMTEAHFDRLEKLLDTVRHDRFDVALLSDEHAVFEDTVRRVYSATDAAGEPTMSVAGAAMLLHLSGNTVPPEFVPGSTAPKEAVRASLDRFMAQVVGHAETRAGWEAIWAAMESDSAAPIWEREAHPGEAVMRAQSAAVLEAGKAAPQLLFVGSYARLADAAAGLRLELGATRVALALERHRLAAGAYPASLDALVPEILNAVPTDWVDGAPLRYRLGAVSAPIVYSLGPDGDDDGGVSPEPEIGLRYVFPSERAAAAEAGTPVPDGDWVLWP